MKLSDFFRSKRHQVGWQGPGSEPNPIVIGALVALVVAGVYMALMMFGKG
jgi:hypothetical protein